MEVVNFTPVLPGSEKKLLSKNNILVSAFYGDIDGLKKAIEEDPRCLDSVDSASGGTALHIASGVGSYSCVEYLITRTKIDLFAQDVLGNTALTRAAKLGHSAVFELLADKMYPNRHLEAKPTPNP